MVCRASGHQGESTPFLYHYPGQQCGGIALTALLYSTIHSINSWKVSDLDKLLVVGDRLHFFQVCCLRFKIGSTQKLTVDELPTKLVAFNYEFHLETDVVVGTTSREAKRNENGSLVLETVLDDCVQNNSFGIVLRFQYYCVACVNSFSEWFLFDSHARSSNGMVCGNGKAILLNFPNSAALASHISEFQSNTADTSFEALVLRKMSRKTTSSQDEMRVTFVPSVVLVRYTSKFGYVELDSGNLQNLEHGYLIDDNLMDFVLLSKAEEKSADFPDNSVYIFSSCFYKKLTDFDPNGIRNWTKRVNIFHKDFVVIPVCTGCHCLLLIVKMNNGTDVSVLLFDSANQSSKRSGLTRHPSVERMVKNYLQDEWAAKSKHQPKSRKITFDEVQYPNCPQQPNSTDCGVYAMKVFVEFLKDLPSKQCPH